MVKIIPADDDGIQKIFSGNRCVGYVQGEVVFAYDQDGYAIEIARIANGASAGAAYLEWIRESKQ